MCRNLFLVIAVVVGFSGCAGTQVQNKESLLTAAGFRTRTPVNAGAMGHVQPNDSI